MRLTGRGRAAPHHSSAHSSLPLCRDLGLSLCVLLPAPALYCKQPTQFWVLRWWRNCPPLPIWPFQSLTERTGGKNTLHSLVPKLKNGWSAAVKGECIWSLLLGRLVWNEVDTAPDIEMFSVTLGCFFLFHLKFNVIHECCKWSLCNGY